MNFWRQDVTKNFTVKLNFVSGDSNVMIPIPEEVMEQLDWTIDTELYLRFRDREILVSTTNYSEDNVRDNVDNYYNEQTQDIGCQPMPDEIRNVIQERMRELTQPIDQQILMCDTKEDILMMACVMLQHVKTMLDSQIGTDGRKKIIREANADD